MPYQCVKCGREWEHATRVVLHECGKSKSPLLSNTDPLTCIYRGDSPIGSHKCQLCGALDRQELIYSCSQFGSCTIRRYKAGTKDTEPTCIQCSRRTFATRNEFTPACSQIRKPS
jgi:hypothetical protein